VSARWRILGAAALFSTGGAAIKACSLTGWQVASLRSGIAAVAVVLMAPSALRALTWRSWLVGTTYAATLALFVTANKLTTSANTIFLQSTAPLYLVLLGPWLLKDRVQRRDVAFMAAMGGGLALFFVGDQARFASAPDPVKGNLLAALSGLAWALTVVGLRWSGRHEEGRPGAGAAAVVAGNALAFVACLPFALPLGVPSLRDAALLLHLGVLQIGLAYVLLTKGLREVPALEASLLLLAEPVLNPFWAWWVQGERPGPFALLGCLVILGAMAWKTLTGPRTDRMAPQAG
jgi:drug/metabolite transporter (DMT)-like permease